MDTDRVSSRVKKEASVMKTEQDPSLVNEKRVRRRREDRRIPGTNVFRRHARTTHDQQGRLRRTHFVTANGSSVGKRVTQDWMKGLFDDKGGSDKPVAKDDGLLQQTSIDGNSDSTQHTTIHRSSDEFLEGILEYAGHPSEPTGDRQPDDLLSHAQDAPFAQGMGLTALTSESDSHSFPRPSNKQASPAIKSETSTDDSILPLIVQQSQPQPSQTPMPSIETAEQSEQSNQPKPNALMRPETADERQRRVQRALTRFQDNIKTKPAKNGRRSSQLKPSGRREPETADERQQRIQLALTRFQQKTKTRPDDDDDGGSSSEDAAVVGVVPVGKGKTRRNKDDDEGSSSGDAAVVEVVPVGRGKKVKREEE